MAVTGRGNARTTIIWGDEFTVAVDHALRLTVRFHVGTYRREADLALPSASALADLLPEITGLCGAPRISRPWQAATAAGVELDPAVPLHRTGLDHGDILILTPRHDAPSPVVRDSAEALVDAAAAPAATGLATAGAVTGCLSLVLVILLFQPAWVALAAGSAAALLVLLWRRGIRVLGLLAALLAAGAGAAVVLADAPADDSSHGWAALAVVLCATLGAGAAAATGGLGRRGGAALAAGGVLLLAAVPGFFLPADTAPAALVLLAGLALITTAPGIAGRWAGLRVPRLPTAGQNLAVSDDPPAGTPHRARRALDLHEGLALGTALGMVPAVLFIGWSGGGFAQALCAATAGAVLLHAARHRHAVPAWAWLLTGLAAGLGSVLAAVNGGGHPVLAGVATIVALAGLSAPLWAERVPELAPTTVVWWERLEMLAVAAALPLAAHLVGLFALIRGMG